MAADPSAAAPPCPPPRPDYEPARFPLPPGACDAHAHVVSADTDRYPLVAARSYTPPPAPESAYLRMLEATGMSRGVLVQISVYGTDNRYMLEVLGRHPRRLRGIAVVDAGVAEAELARMHALGVRGVRLNVLFGGGVGFDALETLAARIAPFGWHLELLLDARQLPPLLSRLTTLPVPVVVDHMGHMPAELGVAHPGFQALLELVGRQGGWAKLSGAYRIDSDQRHYANAARLAAALIEAAPERLVYGSDWPHVAVPHAMPDTGHLRNLLGEWIADATLRRRILVDNPAVLYDF
ncbi:amidohydrolase family protein [Aerosticca soli]|uniref:Putative 2-pyrone-4,6-dicarboxylic acid hydrolase n=1 Tax=Aerosticca soli TaxID=2010829 RepID=A0A2Z6E4R6_9GAMM|nr:amidohydrolase family protein [Aerosticca soli]BBD80080.1 putative 2-pyrone-4,6-dicarboxylic acid hydrolase [Aerosticca soli]